MLDEDISGDRLHFLFLSGTCMNHRTWVALTKVNFPGFLKKKIFKFGLRRWIVMASGIQPPTLHGSEG